MKKHLLIFVCSLFALTSTAQKLENTLLWQISGNGIETPSYLFGTIHASCEIELQDTVMTAMENTDQLYLEIDMDDPELQVKMMAGMNMKEGKTLSSLISEEDFELLNTFLIDKIGIPATMLNTIKPFMINTMLLPILLDCEFQSVEVLLVQHYQEVGKEILGLETVEDQLRIFDKIPYQSQAEELVKTVRTNMEDDRAELRKLQELYNGQDIEGILTAIQESENQIMNYQEDLLTTRNRNWIPVIAKAAEKAPTFFAVGAGHLAGKEGVIHLLREAGYSVEPIIN